MPNDWTSVAESYISEILKNSKVSDEETREARGRTMSEFKSFYVMNQEAQLKEMLLNAEEFFYLDVAIKA
jgi:hypothetical protein